MGVQFAIARRAGRQRQGAAASIQGEIDRFNTNLDRQEKIRRFALLPRDFTIDDDEITPSLKVKRKIIDKKYKTRHRRACTSTKTPMRARRKTGLTMTSLAEAPPRTGPRFRIEREGDLAIVWFDLPGEKVEQVLDRR